LHNYNNATVFQAYWRLGWINRPKHIDTTGVVMQNTALRTDGLDTVATSAHPRMKLVDSTEPLAAGRLSVLLVEDDEADVYLIRRALANNPRIGEIVVARDGVEALDMIDQRAIEPDLAIVDLNMPRKDGFSLLRDLASRNVARFPTVVLTSSRAGADQFRAKKRGAFAYLAKPNSAAKLATALDQLIARL